MGYWTVEDVASSLSKLHKFIRRELLQPSTTSAYQLEQYEESYKRLHSRLGYRHHPSPPLKNHYPNLAGYPRSLSCLFLPTATFIREKNEIYTSSFCVSNWVVCYWSDRTFTYGYFPLMTDDVGISIPSTGLLITTYALGGLATN